MNICPGCEAEIEEGMKLCPECAGEEKAEIPDAIKEMEEDEALLTLEDGQSFSLQQDETVLGRRDPLEGIDPDVDLSVHGGFESGVSRRHALIYRSGKDWSLEDLGSTNGTVVNRQKVSPGDPVHLAEGDVIHLGHLKAVFHVGARMGGAS
jgi:pSer/pThr/pTyr-binding forkhead associated (FHA) protein